ncbi:hypothetical protein LTR78_006003 [Recurvomyces mirabilis]|uniref:Uncharacterized protein n=1 Tax=Recurvomyces mirabilis TaxID=574656 RepID=A0AAE1C0T9_9PEZI|nr:hypothetical protein LTR78_006003 [Recurvomyces mirabilis]KAK5155187.1 hypothetical protein LTS14_006142 [Recurvomyces mirabilis]
MLRKLVLAGALLVAGSNADLNYTIPAARCVDTTSYDTCSNGVDSTFQGCTTRNGANNDDIVACADTANAFRLGCIYQYCWNVVYSCEVQQLVSLVAQTEGNGGIPYYPAPDNALGGCSCNLELVEEVVIGSLSALGACSNTYNNNAGCECCAQAGAYAGLYSVCPSVDPKYLLATLPGTDTLLTIYDPPFAQCGSVLQQTDCEKDLGYPALPSPLTYLSAAPSTTGTASYSDLSGSLNAPSASVVPYILVGNITISITAASVGGAGTSNRPATTSAGAAGGSLTTSTGSSHAAASGSGGANNGSQTSGGGAVTASATASRGISRSFGSQASCIFMAMLVMLTSIGGLL